MPSGAARWALTPPFHPYSGKKTSRSGIFLLHWSFCGISSAASFFSKGLPALLQSGLSSDRVLYRLKKTSSLFKKTDAPPAAARDHKHHLSTNIAQVHKLFKPDKKKNGDFQQLLKTCPRHRAKTFPVRTGSFLYK